MFALKWYGGSTAKHRSECQAREQSRPSLPENAVESRNARHVISDYEDSVYQPFLLTPSSGGCVGSKLGNHRAFIPFAVEEYLQLASPVLCTTLIVW